MCGFLPPAGVSCALLAERRAARASRTEARAGMGGACGGVSALAWQPASGHSPGVRPSKT
jgi:hypothetical protein